MIRTANSYPEAQRGGSLEVQAGNWAVFAVEGLFSETFFQAATRRVKINGKEHENVCNARTE